MYERADYACSQCHHGHCPTDDELRIEGEQTLGDREGLALAGVKPCRMCGVDAASAVGTEGQCLDGAIFNPASATAPKTRSSREFLDQ